MYRLLLSLTVVGCVAFAAPSRVRAADVPRENSQKAPSDGDGKREQKKPDPPKPKGCYETVDGKRVWVDVCHT